MKTIYNLNKLDNEKEDLLYSALFVAFVLGFMLALSIFKANSFIIFALGITVEVWLISIFITLNKCKEVKNGRRKAADSR